MRMTWLLLFGLAGWAQERQTLEPRPPAASRHLEDGSFLVAAGTPVPLSLMNSISSKNSAVGDQVYLRTTVPVAVDGRIVIPVGTYVVGTVTKSVRPGKVKGKGEIALRFDRLLFDDGRTVDLAGRFGAMDGDNPGTMDRKEGKVTSDSSAGRDAMIVGGSAAGGTMMGRWIGDSGRGAGIGAGAGAAAGLTAVLLTRGPDATLRKGASVEMVLNRDLRIETRR